MLAFIFHDLLVGRTHGQQHVGARVAVGYRIDVKGIDDLLVALSLLVMLVSFDLYLS